MPEPLRIGVTGHRFLDEVEKLSAGIDQTLAQLEEAFPGRKWTVLSPLAEGADRLVVWRAIRFRPFARLVVPLPLAVDSYQRDFETYESRLEFQDMLDLADVILPPPLAPSREEAYYAAGEYVIRQADVVVALWDGRGAESRGGTGEMVALARQRQIPLAWVHCANHRPGNHAAVNFTGEQGQVEFERLTFTK